MSIKAKAVRVVNETYADEYVAPHMTPLKVVQALADAGLLAPKPITPEDIIDALYRSSDGVAYIETAAGMLEHTIIDMQVDMNAVAQHLNQAAELS
ncbi:MAG: hypothetical protein L0K27_02725 [Corynebacterium nuruki]|nr:hypothetical protein [Corynebacterium nuruki]